MALRSGETSPAQFVFDLGLICGLEGVLAFVISGAAAWVQQGTDAIVAATLAQGHDTLGPCLASPLQLLRVITEKRATFLCSPGLRRPSMQVLPGLLAVGDYVAGPYPSTLEGAMRSGIAAASAID
jgi:hydroxysqualene dehydroxylase